MAEERVQRRLAAILAADVVGYSRLMDVDEAGTLAQLKTVRSDVFDPKIEAFGGRVFKNTGDGVMAEFAAFGIAAGLLASAGASVLAAIVAERIFELQYTFNPLLWITGLVAGIVVVCTSGLVAARGAIHAPPASVLRAA